MSKRARKLGVALASVALTLLLAEIGVRVHAFRGEQRLPTEETPVPPPNKVAWLKQIIRPHPLDEVLYELKPGIVDVRFLGHSLSTNRHGFRGPELEPIKPPRHLRIVGIGDSVMFGWGVEAEAVYLRGLEGLLNASYPSRRWEAVNTAVPGYNTVMQVATLREKGLAFEPDLVVVGIVANDLDLPNFIREKQDYLALDRSFLAEAIRDARSSYGSESGAELFATTQEQRNGGFRALEGNPEQIPFGYHDMLGWDAYGRALDDLAELADREGFEVVFVSIWAGKINVRMLDEAAAKGFATFVVQPDIERYKRAHGIENYFDSVMSVSSTDPHPSSVTHGLVSKGLLRTLEEEGIVERLLAKEPSTDE